MSDAHFASLSSTLLARKGGAKPAMRPQSAALGPVDGVAAAANLEDLGWNDMGEDTPAASTAAPAAAAKLASPSLSESGLIKKPALPPIDEREPLDSEPDDQGTGGKDTSSVVALGPLQVKQNAVRSNTVHDSLASISDRLESRAPIGADNEDDAGDTSDAVEAAEPTPAAAPAPIKPSPAHKPAAAKGKRAAFTLRLDQQRHLMLRLACTVRGSSAQQLVTDALDQLLAEMPEIAMLAAQVQQRPN